MLVLSWNALLLLQLVLIILLLLLLLLPLLPPVLLLLLQLPRPPHPPTVRTQVIHLPERTWTMPITQPCPIRCAAVLRSIVLVICRCCCLW